MNSSIFRTRIKTALFFWALAVGTMAFDTSHLGLFPTNDKADRIELRQAGFLSMLKEIFQFFGGDGNAAQNATPTTREIAPGMIEYTYIVPPAPIPAEVIDRNGATSVGTELVTHQGKKLIDRHAVCRNVRNSRLVATQGTASSSLNLATQAVFVPVRTAAEWASFRANPPSDISFSGCVPGCFDYTVPNGVFTLRIVAIGAGGGGSRSTPGCAYVMLAGAGGATVVATVSVTPGDTIPYCVGIGGRKPLGAGWSASPRNCGDSAGGTGGDTYFGGYLRARGGSGGNGWHYKNEDRQGTPPSRGGTATVGAGTMGVGAISVNNGGTVSNRGNGVCGGNAFIPPGEPALVGITGLGACNASNPGGQYGGGGYSRPDAHYSEGDASAGADGYMSIEPL